jgi:hypothetical protein
MKKLHILFIVSIVFLSSCGNDPSISIDHENQNVSQVFNVSQTIRNNGNFLDFAYYDEFEATRKFHYLRDRGTSMDLNYSTYKPIAPKDLATQLGFKSMGHIFDELIEIQNDYIGELMHRYHQLSKEEKEQLNQNGIDKFAPQVRAKQHMLLLDEETGTFQMKVHDTELAYLLNEDGIIAVAGAVYQYTDTKVKFMPMNGSNTINDLLETESDNEANGIRVSTIEVKYVDFNEQKGGLGSTSCRGEEKDPISGPGFSASLRYYYHTGGFIFTNYTTYSNTYNCAYDSAYYTCWYQETSGMSYEQKLQACCDVVSTPIQNSRVTSSLIGYSRQKMIFWWMHLRHNKISMRINGSANYTRNGVFTNIPVNSTRFNTDEMGITIYDGPFINAINANLTFTSVARTDVPDIVCTISW